MCNNEISFLSLKLSGVICCVGEPQAGVSDWCSNHDTPLLCENILSEIIVIANLISIFDMRRTTNMWFVRVCFLAFVLVYTCAVEQSVI